MPGPVEVRDEGNPVIVDVGQPLLALGDDVIGLHPAGILHQDLPEPRAEGHDLEPAAVGERRAGPIHECPETAGFRDDIGAGLQVEVVGVGENSLGPERTYRFAARP